MANYDDFLYSDYPHAETHPSRLYALGRLFGLQPAHPSRCRVLELGCGLGGNLIALGAALPGSELLGIDLSARQIAAGADLLRTLGLRNVTLRAEDIRDFAGRETFDYVLCHGIYSWVPDDVQARILEIAGTLLAPQGLAYISYNTLPGWHMRGMVRDLLRRAAREIPDTGSPKDRIARARDLLAFLGHMPEEQHAAQAFLTTEVQLLNQLGDEYLLYEHLVERNRPQYFDDFAAAAARAGLAYVTDAHFGSALPARYPPDVLAAAGGDTLVQTEARLDLLEVRFFRRSVLCRAAAHPSGPSGPYAPPTWERLQGLHVTTSLAPLAGEPDLRSEEAEDFRGLASRGISAHRPMLKAALTILHEERPMGLPFEALCEQAAQRLGKKRPTRAARAELGESLLDLLARGFVELHAGAPAMAPRPGPKPRVTELTRLQASRGQAGCTNLRNESIAVDDLDRCLLRRLDGGYELDELGELVLIDSRAGGFSLEMNGEPVSGREAMTAAAKMRLEALARSGFLLG